MAMQESHAIDNATDALTCLKNFVVPVNRSSAQQGNVTGLEGSALSVKVLYADTFTQECGCKSGWFCTKAVEDTYQIQT